MRATPRTTLPALFLFSAVASLSVPAFAQGQPLPPPPGAQPAQPPAAPPGAQPAPPPPGGGFGPAPGAQPGPAPGAQPGPGPGAPPPGWGFTADSGGFRTQGGPPPPPPPPEDEQAYRAGAMLEGTTISGSTGLLRVANATSAPVGTFRAQVLWDYWSGSGFLCNSATPCRTQKDDSVSRFGATFTMSATVASFLEGYVGIRSYATSNDQGKPELLQVLGDTTVGVKAFLPTERYRMFNAGLDLQLLLLNGSGGVGLDTGSTSFRGRGVVTGDFRKAPQDGGGIPLLVHFNAGYRFDNSGKIVEATEEKRGKNPIERVERYGLGINRVDFAELGLGFEGVFAAGETVRWVRPFLEYTADIPMNRQSYTCNPTKTSSGDACLGNESSFKAVPSRLTAGLRVNAFLPGLMLTAAGDLGVSGTSLFLEEVAPQAPWTVWWGLGYAFDTVEKPPVVKVQQVEKIVQSSPPPTYAIKGAVHENGKTEGVGGAIVTFQGRDMTGLVTDAGGKFVTANLEPGTYTFTVKADGYKEGTCTATVTPSAPPPPPMMPPPQDPNAPPGMMPMAPPPPAPTPMTSGPMVTDVDCALEALPKLGNVVGQVVQGEGGGGVGGATVIMTDSAGKERQATTDGSGNFRFDAVALGAVKLRATQPDYMGGRGEVTVEPRKDAKSVISVNKRPKNSSVVVGKREIIIKQQVRFETDSAKILSDSSVLLEEIADALQRNPQIKVVEIQGHTDNTGTAQRNKDLSEQRANAVRDRLVSLGVSSSRLTAKGYGAERPIVPNVTAGNRARNRRVALVITESDKLGQRAGQLRSP